MDNGFGKVQGYIKRIRELKKKGNKFAIAILVVIVAVIVLVIVGKPIYDSHQQQKVKDEYIAAFNQETKERLGVKPAKVTIKFKKSAPEPMSATIKFSKKDVYVYPFLKTIQTNKSIQSSNEAKATDVTFSIPLENSNPENAPIKNVVAAKINPIPTQIMMSLLDQVELPEISEGLHRPSLLKPNPNKPDKLYRQLDQKKGKVFLKNYNRLEELSDRALIDELTKLDLIGNFQFLPESKNSKETSQLALKELVKHPYIYVKNVLDSQAGSYGPNLGETEIFHFKANERLDYFHGKDAPYTISAGRLIINSDLMHVGLYNVKKAGTNTYQGTMEVIADANNKYEVEIKTKL